MSGTRGLTISPSCSAANFRALTINRQARCGDKPSPLFRKTTRQVSFGTPNFVDNSLGVIIHNPPFNPPFRVCAISHFPLLSWYSYRDRAYWTRWLSNGKAWSRSSNSASKCNSNGTRTAS